jgi:hypothetical protein
MSEEDKRIARQGAREPFEKGNLEAAEELIHPTSSTTTPRRVTPRHRRD